MALGQRSYGGALSHTIPLFLSHEQRLKYHGLFLSHLCQHCGSSLCGHLAVVGSVRSLMPFQYSFKTKIDLTQTKTKAPPDSSLYVPSRYFLF
ncbi:hypothetical protein RGQ29_024912 [Quercus rubra]|uniref:Uncharacterized protein n=1 Tax=Quercus rubra TaxID=3512 RepID=A0AAN7EY90_QUERU|nr:hypothetical protein RGQ29_024912 [Quercus rubra]